MVESKLDLTELDRLNLEMLKMANETCPEETKKFIRKQGAVLKKEMRAQYKEKTKKKTGNLLKGMHESAPYQYEGSYQVRVSNNAPHAHLIEYGHKMLGHDKKETKRDEVKGLYPAQAAGEGFAREYMENVDDFIDELLEKGFSL